MTDRDPHERPERVLGRERHEPAQPVEPPHDALDPFGAGTCLQLAGLFFARPLWSMKLLTVPDFFPRGAWQLRCALETPDGVTVLAEDLAEFAIE